jgi:heme exporter protein B
MPLVSSSAPVPARPASSSERAVKPRPPTWPRQAGIILHKDVLIELKTGEVVTTSAFFGCVIVILSSLAFVKPAAPSLFASRTASMSWVDSSTQAEVAAAAIWLSIAFAAVLSLSRTWQRERQDRAFDALVVSPLSQSAIFMGKALGLCVFLLAVEVVVVPTAALLLRLDLIRHGASLCVIVLLATPGIAAAGALFGVMTVRTRARDLLLAIVLFPLLSPTLLAASASTRNLFDGVPLGDLVGFLQVMGLFDVAFFAGGLALFPALTDGG